MKKRMMLAVLLGVLMLAGNSLADQLAVNDIIKFTDSVGSTAGGQFTVNRTSSIGVDPFETFCIEYYSPPEYLAFGDARFKIVGINDYATLGGGGAVGGQDLLDARTKWLFYNFTTGALDDKVAGYFYGDINDANALQQAIWFIEQENGGLNNYLVAAAAAAILAGDTQGLEYVKALNLVWATDNPYGGIGAYAQDVLYVATPEPVSMLLFGSGLVGVGGYLRRRFKK